MEGKGVNTVPKFPLLIQNSKKDLVSPENYVWISDDGGNSNLALILSNKKGSLEYFNRKRLFGLG